MRILSWNLFHGRSRPPAGRSLLPEFSAALNGWAWDVAVLQEVPPWWPAALARACGASAACVPTSRNWLLPLRRAIASRNPDLLKSNGGGANAILVRGEIGAHARSRLTLLPERRVAHGVRLGDGTWVVNLHASTHPPGRPEADGEGALAAALAWAGDAPLVLGGDLNQTRPRFASLARLAGHHVDHLLARGCSAASPGELLDAGALSDHRPLAVGVGCHTRTP